MLVYVGPFGTRLFPAHVKLKLTNSFSIKLAKSYAIGLNQHKTSDEGGLLYPENPSHPPGHIIIRNHVSPRQNHQRNARRRKLQRIIEIRAYNPHCPKEQTHAYVPAYHE